MKKGTVLTFTCENPGTPEAFEEVFRKILLEKLSAGWSGTAGSFPADLPRKVSK